MEIDTSRTEQLHKAIMAHGRWKTRLCDAVFSGSSEWTVEQVQVDHLCDFGRWFNSLPESLKDCCSSQDVHRLHAEFHRETAGILELALNGRQDEVKTAMAPEGRFATLSRDLVAALIVWQEKRIRDVESEANQVEKGTDVLVEIA